VADKVLLIGTSSGALRAERHGREYALGSLGIDRYGGVRCPIVVDRGDPDTLYAGTIKAGVLRSRDGGATWRPVNDGLDKTEVWWLAQHPVTGDLWAGVSPAAMYKSTDQGDHWRECEQIQALPRRAEWSFPPPPHIPHVKHIDLRPDDPDDVIAAVEEGWLIRTTDGGATWTNLTNGSEFDSHTAYFAPGSAEVILSTSGSGVYRSEDGGATFVESQAGLDRRYMAHLALHTARPEVVYTAAAAVPPPGWSRPEGAQSAFYRSDDRGKTWRRLVDGVPERLAAAPRAVASDPTEPDTVYVGMTDGTLWVTEDGRTFAPALELAQAAVTGVTVLPSRQASSAPG
jgi:photosystem II stability/assembly factor-like uncharacterized protein